MNGEAERLRELAAKARRLAALTVVAADAQEILAYAEDCERRALSIEKGEMTGYWGGQGNPTASKASD